MLGVEVVLADGRIMNCFETEKEQHRLRPAPYLHRRRRHARHHNRRGGQAVPASARGGNRLRRRALSSRRAEAAQSGPGARRRHGDQLRADRARRHRIRASSTATASVIRSPATRLVCADGSLVAARRRPARKLSSNSSPTRARTRPGRRCHLGRQPRSGQGFWHLREKLDGGAEARGRIDQGRRLGAGRSGSGISWGSSHCAAKAIVPGCRPVPFGHLGDGNVHFNVSQPVGADTAQFLRAGTRSTTPSTRLCSSTTARFRPSTVSASSSATCCRR